MKNLNKIAVALPIGLVAAALLSASSAMAGTITQTKTVDVYSSSGPSDFVFAQFNSSGVTAGVYTGDATLTGITVTITADERGYISVQPTNGDAHFSNYTAKQDFSDTAGNVVLYTKTYSLNTTPGTTGVTTILNGVNQTFSLGSGNNNMFAGGLLHNYSSPTGSLINTSTEYYQTPAIDTPEYLGSSTFNYAVDNTVSYTLTQAGGGSSISTIDNNTYGHDIITVTYDFTSVPEASQVAASSLALIGIGGFAARRRFSKKA